MQTILNFECHEGHDRCAWLYQNSDRTPCLSTSRDVTLCKLNSPICNRQSCLLNMEHNNMLRFGCIHTYCVASLGKEDVRAFGLRRGGKLLLGRCMLVEWSQRLMKLSPGVVKALHSTYKKYRKVGVLGFVFKVDCWLKPITVEDLTRYCDALPKSKLRKWGFWGGVVGFCWRTICAKRCSFLGSPILHQQIRGPKTLIGQWFCYWHQCLYTLSNYHCATSSLDVLTSQQCKVVSTCSWRGSCGCLASRNGWWRYSQEDCGWLSKDQVMLRALHLITCLMRVFGWTSWSIWLDRLARPVGWKFPTPRNDSVKAFTLATTCNWTC